MTRSLHQNDQSKREEASKKIFGGTLLKWGSVSLWGLFALRLTTSGFRPWPWLLGVSFAASLWLFMGLRAIRIGRTMLSQLDAEQQTADTRLAHPVATA
jgi:hypothetical protein